jgi:hypothetical protein
MIVLLFLAPLFTALPLAVLAGIIIMALRGNLHRCRVVSWTRVVFSAQASVVVLASQEGHGDLARLLPLDVAVRRYVWLLSVLGWIYSQDLPSVLPCR